MQQNPSNNHTAKHAMKRRSDQTDAAPCVPLALGREGQQAAAAEARGLPWNAVELQMLRGMADSLKLACVEQNLRVRQYVPIGELVPGMAYLVRRLLENTSNESWLRSGFAKNADLDALLASPDATEDRRWDALLAPEHHALTPPEAGVGDGQLFFNEPLRDFARAAGLRAGDFARGLRAGDALRAPPADWRRVATMAAACSWFLAAMR